MEGGSGKGTRGKKGTGLGRMGGRVEGSGEGMGGGRPEARDGGDGSREATVRERWRWEGVKVDGVNGPIGLDFWAFFERWLAHGLIGLTVYGPIIIMN